MWYGLVPLMANVTRRVLANETHPVGSASIIPGAQPRAIRADGGRNRQRIITVATQLLRLNPAVTMDDVVDACGLGRTTIFRHFGRRDDLVEAVLEGVVAAVDESLEAARLETLDPRAAIEGLCSLAVELADRFGVLMSNNAAFDACPAVAGRGLLVIDRCTAICRAAQDAMVLRADVPAEWLVAVLVASAQAMAEAIVSGSVRKVDAQRLMFDQFVNGSRVQPG
jgi:TetR/AcrR family transcriptional regulator, mexCD-oprJ operon repressor